MARAGHRRLRSWRSGLDITNVTQAEQLVSTVRAALAQDLDTPRVIKLLDGWVRQGTFPTGGAVAEAFGDDPSVTQAYQPGPWPAADAG